MKDYTLHNELARYAYSIKQPTSTHDTLTLTQKITHLRSWAVLARGLEQFYREVYGQYPEYFDDELLFGYLTEDDPEDEGANGTSDGAAEGSDGAPESVAEGAPARNANNPHTAPSSNPTNPFSPEDLPSDSKDYWISALHRVELFHAFLSQDPKQVPRFLHYDTSSIWTSESASGASNPGSYTGTWLTSWQFSQGIDLSAALGAHHAEPSFTQNPPADEEDYNNTYDPEDTQANGHELPFSLNHINILGADAPLLRKRLIQDSRQFAAPRDPGESTDTDDQLTSEGDDFDESAALQTAVNQLADAAEHALELDPTCLGAYAILAEAADDLDAALGHVLGGLSCALSMMNENTFGRLDGYGYLRCLESLSRIYLFHALNRRVYGLKQEFIESLSDQLPFALTEKTSELDLTAALAAAQLENKRALDALPYPAEPQKQCWFELAATLLHFKCEQWAEAEEHLKHFIELDRSAAWILVYADLPSFYIPKRPLSWRDKDGILRFCSIKEAAQMAVYEAEPLLRSTPGFVDWLYSKPWVMKLVQSYETE